MQRLKMFAQIKTLSISDDCIKIKIIKNAVKLRNQGRKWSACDMCFASVYAFFDPSYFQLNFRQTFCDEGKNKQTNKQCDEY